MDILEMNDVSTNNLATKDVLPSSNLSTSDELSCPEMFSLDTEPKYAIKKRKTSLSKPTLFKITISVSLVSGGLLLANVFVGSAPVINNFDTCYEVVDHTFKYDLDVTIVTAKLKMLILDQEETLQEYIFESSGVYSGEYELVESKEYQVKFYSTNLLDYYTELSEYNITFVI